MIKRKSLSQKEELVPGLQLSLRRNFKRYAEDLDKRSQRLLIDFLRLRGENFRPEPAAFAAVLQDVELMDVVKEITAASLWECGADDKMADFVLELIDMIPQLAAVRKLRHEEEERENLQRVLDEFTVLGTKYMRLNDCSKKRIKMIGPKVRPLFLDFAFAPAIHYLLEHWER